MQNLDEDYRRGYSCYKAKKKQRPLHLTFLSYLFLCSRKQLTMSWDFFIKGNLQEAYWSKYCWLILNKFYKSRN